MIAMRNLVSSEPFAVGAYMRNVSFIVITLVGLAGCEDSIDSSAPSLPGEDSETSSPVERPESISSAVHVAEVVFNHEVAPILRTRCGSCHTHGVALVGAPGFVAAGAVSPYRIAHRFDSLLGDLTAEHAPILTLIAAGHMGVTYTSDEVSKITEWLPLEAAARHAGGPDY